MHFLAPNHYDCLLEFSPNVKCALISRTKKTRILFLWLGNFKQKTIHIIESKSFNIPIDLFSKFSFKSTCMACGRRIFMCIRFGKWRNDFKLISQLKNRRFFLSSISSDQNLRRYRLNLASISRFCTFFLT